MLGLDNYFLDMNTVDHIIVHIYTLMNELRYHFFKVQSVVCDLRFVSFEFCLEQLVVLFLCSSVAIYAQKLYL